MAVYMVMHTELVFTVFGLGEFSNKTVLNQAFEILDSAQNYMQTISQLLV